METRSVPVNPLPLRRTNTLPPELPPDRLDELRARYLALRADRAAPRSLRSYARAALAEIRRRAAA